MLILISGFGRFDYLASVEWDTLPPLVAGLCVMVGTLVKTGVITDLPHGRERNGAAVRCRPGDDHSRFVVRLEGSSTAVRSRLIPAWA